MSHDVATDWLLLVALNSRSVVDGSYDLIRDYDGDAELSVSC